MSDELFIFRVKFHQYLSVDGVGSSKYEYDRHVRASSITEIEKKIKAQFGEGAIITLVDRTNLQLIE